PRPGERARARQLGPEAWLDDQLSRARRGDAGLDLRLAAHPSLTLTPEAMAGEDEFRDMRRGRQPDPKQKRRMAMRLRQVAVDLAGARFVRAVHGERALLEVMIDFWSNHFSIFARKSLVAGLLPEFQRNALERHALGRFGDLLLATAKSPAMLVSLDNWNSTAPRGPGLARLVAGRGGINENYARELLELHTLGVDGGYTQRDVEEVARVLTGWTLESRRKPVFRFRPQLHDDGTKRVLGRTLRGGGMAEGEKLLKQLAEHPSTARHVSRKLARRFVADDPPRALVDRAAGTFERTRGDISQVLRTILLSPEMADPVNRKLKTPLRFAASALRETDGETDGGRPVLAALGRLGEVPFFARTPAGFPEYASAWADPGAALERMGFAFALAHERLSGTWPGEATPARAPRPRGLSRAEALAVQLASPEFQWV
ncbi:MAG: DUF1800 domain-containing protein, partial [Deltaproteobacteria bacterium]|nr:DUF1800 domain-containing protein [Deltaproteobacteria bacterium]